METETLECVPKQTQGLESESSWAAPGTRGLLNEGL